MECNVKVYFPVDKKTKRDYKRFYLLVDKRRDGEKRNSRKMKEKSIETNIRGAGSETSSIS